jgi:hypothetical protein
VIPFGMARLSLRGATKPDESRGGCVSIELGELLYRLVFSYAEDALCILGLCSIVIALALPAFAKGLHLRQLLGESIKKGRCCLK